MIAFLLNGGIFKHPLQVGIKRTGKVFICAARLHNFCVDERMGNDESNGSAAMDSGTETCVPSDISTIDVHGNSMIRDIVVQDIASKDLSRPMYNLQLNRN